MKGIILATPIDPKKIEIRFMLQSGSHSIFYAGRKVAEVWDSDFTHHILTNILKSKIQIVKDNNPNGATVIPFKPLLPDGA